MDNKLHPGLRFLAGLLGIATFLAALAGAMGYFVSVIFGVPAAALLSILPSLGVSWSRRL